MIETSKNFSSRQFCDTELTHGWIFHEHLNISCVWQYFRMFERNFLRQFCDENMDLTTLSASQFIKVWNHYDTDGKQGVTYSVLLLAYFEHFLLEPFTLSLVIYKSNPLPQNFPFLLPPPSEYI